MTPWNLLNANIPPASEEATGGLCAFPLFLPPYSPDINPIELAFSKLCTGARL